ncbi:MAG: hypothetical protein IKR74_04910 [Bacilli bacterium]|nr:hypothetical protein [Bacilli bacterium]
MFNIIERYISKLSKEDINNFAKSKNIILNENELDFTYSFIKKNYKDILKNPNLFNIDLYKNKYQSDNFNKIKKVFVEYFSKYQKFL